MRYCDGNQELLIGENDKKTAEKLRLRFEQWPHDDYKHPQANKFVKWVKQNLDDGFPVIAGFYQRYNEDEVDDEQEYNHIMPITGYTHDSHGDLQFYFNDLWKPTVSVTHQLYADRDDFLTKDDPEQPFEYTLPQEECFGIAIMGFKNADGCYRCKLDIANQFFEPDWGAEDKLDQRPQIMEGKLSIIGLTPGKDYKILRFDSVDSIAFKDLSSVRPDMLIHFTADSVNVVKRLPLMKSDGAYFYRVVDAL